MCKIIAVAMQKGGCAKTSVSLNLGVGLARAGKKVLLIDNDPQGNLTASFDCKTMPSHILSWQQSVLRSSLHHNTQLLNASIYYQTSFSHIHN